MSIKIDEPTRLAILKAYDARIPISKIAEMFGVCRSYPTKLAKRRNKTMRGHKPAGGEDAGDQ